MATKNCIEVIAEALGAAKFNSGTPGYGGCYYDAIQVATALQGAGILPEEVVAAHINEMDEGDFANAMVAKRLKDRGIIP